MKSLLYIAVVSFSSIYPWIVEGSQIQLLMEENSQLKAQIREIRRKFDEEKRKILVNAAHERNRITTVTQDALKVSESRVYQYREHISELKSELRRCRMNAHGNEKRDSQFVAAVERGCHEGIAQSWRHYADAMDDANREWEKAYVASADTRKIENDDLRRLNDLVEVARTTVIDAQHRSRILMTMMGALHTTKNSK